MTLVGGPEEEERKLRTDFTSKHYYNCALLRDAMPTSKIRGMLGLLSKGST